MSGVEAVCSGVAISVPSAHARYRQPRVGRHQQRHVRPSLCVPDVGLDASGVGVVVAHTTGVVAVHDAVDEVIIEPVVQVDEQLPHLFVDAH